MKSKTKIWALVIATAVPGMSMFSCTSRIARDFRDAAINGAATFITAETIDLLSICSGLHAGRIAFVASASLSRVQTAGIAGDNLTGPVCPGAVQPFLGASLPCSPPHPRPSVC